MVKDGKANVLLSLCDLDIDLMTTSCGSTRVKKSEHSLTNNRKIDARITRLGLAKINSTSVDGLVVHTDVAHCQDGRLVESTSKRRSFFQDVFVEPNAGLRQGYFSGIGTVGNKIK